MLLIYKPSDVMKRFCLKESVYKKYITALEKEGYIFQRNQQGHRIFSEKDIQTLEIFLELIKYDGMTIELVAKRISKTNNPGNTTEQKQDSYDVMTLVENAVSIALENQKKELTSQFQRTQKQLEQIESRTKERDKLLVESLRETQEVKKLLLEVQKEIAVTKENKKQRWWQNFF